MSQASASGIRTRWAVDMGRLVGSLLCVCLITVCGCVERPTPQAAKRRALNRDAASVSEVGSELSSSPPIARLKLSYTVNELLDAVDAVEFGIRPGLPAKDMIESIEPTFVVKATPFVTYIYTTTFTRSVAVVTKEGRIVAARYDSCVRRKKFFDIMSARDRIAYEDLMVKVRKKTGWIQPFKPDSPTVAPPQF